MRIRDRMVDGVQALAARMRGRKEWRFQFGAALPASDPLARWVTVLALAYNDTLLIHRLFVRPWNEPHENLYFFRIASAHLYELGDRLTVLAAGYDEWPQVRGFVGALPAGRQADFTHLRTLRPTPGSLGDRLGRLRNSVFHYPHLHAQAAQRGRLELAHVLHELGNEEGRIRVARRVKGIRSLFADEVAARILTRHIATPPGLESFVVEVREAQLALMRFAEAALDSYFRSLPSGTVTRV